MTCVELQESLAEIEDGTNTAQLAHLKTCRECSTLVNELLVIASSAAELREANDPSPRVWNSIEIALRQEGLIHPPRPNRSLIPWSGSRWAWTRWAAPVAALLLITVGIWMRETSHTTDLAKTVPAPQTRTSDPEVAAMNDGNDGLKDDDLLKEVATLSPAMQLQYTDNLHRANEYIRDAKSVVDQYPNDAEARRSLLEAYQQKAMLFELAMDRSLP
jgi:hypothetical protein